MTRPHGWVATVLELVGVVALFGCGAAATGATSDRVVPSTPTTLAARAVPPPATVVATTEPATTLADPPTSAPATTLAAAATAPPAPVVRSGAVVSDVVAVGDPLSISIPTIGVDSVLVPAGVLEDGTVAVPPDPSIAGWFTGGPRPGERGPAVIMGHVDSKASGPGVFYELRDLEVGAVATVETTTGPVRFVVQSVQQYPKDEFPTDLVYGSVPEPSLRLVTCGGSFDRSIGHYRDNIVAFLVPVEGSWISID
jgi:hypothetical protein